MEAIHQADETILIVDDEWSIREAICELLQDAGYQCAQARDGREALDYLRQTAQLPAMILLDMMMPDVGGVQFLIQQQEDAGLAHIPVIMMTANPRLIRAGELLGMQEHLDKPFTADALLTLVDHLCLK